MVKIEVFKVLSSGGVKSISYKQLSDEGIRCAVDAFEKSNIHREATLRGENCKCGWLHKRYLKKWIREYDEKIKILSEELGKRGRVDR